MDPPSLPPERSLPLLPEDHVFQTPVKRIFSDTDIPIWLDTEAFSRIMIFIENLNTSVVDKKISDPCHISENVTKILTMLDTIDAWTDEIPPLQNPQRFGNKAFRTWIARLDENIVSLQRAILSTSRHDAIPELTPYLAGAFGNATRIDYGSGHELSFATWMCALEMLGIVGAQDRQAMVLKVFVRYLEAVRRLQRIYMLEPAGSHGVWGLDDYQFLPYLWGSAQLRDHRRLKPRSILQLELVDSFAGEYMYFRCIQSIFEFKRGPFHEHSPILNDIANVPGWPKVNTGMVKMYVAEVLRKAPVVQHLPFGSLLPYVPRERKEEAGEGAVEGVTEANVPRERKEEVREEAVAGVTEVKVADNEPVVRS
ncbi:hypothetical protein BC937DRAFT_94451 [Endogone sp. FLAS-F59071]|nr:hypothetical protein BC937DRAFT_94451 [Endogone sp. FLAS-F59071]|eukprot:RUS14031.1 hypothetical protein BC937DRAFT_94451 [Endogone sp. FLAS-F59071]